MSVETPSDVNAQAIQPKSPSVSASNAVFLVSMGIIGATYVVLIIAMLAADTWYMAEKTVRSAEGDSWQALLVENPVVTALADRKIRYSIWLSLTSCTLSAVFSLLVAVPTGYLMARHEFRGKRLLDAVLDIPIVLPPLVVGLSLLILFQYPPFSWVAEMWYISCLLLCWLSFPSRVRLLFGR